MFDPNRRFVVVEGVDGVGKTTFVERLKTFLETVGFDVVTTREPASLGQGLRQVLVEDDNDLSAQEQYLLFLADRLHNTRTRILPALVKNKIVISDRYQWSSLAYQGSLGVKRAWMDQAAQGRLVIPGLTVWLRCDSFERDRRLVERGDTNQRFGGRDMQSIVDQYHGLYSEWPYPKMEVDTTDGIKMHQVTAAAHHVMRAVVPVENAS